MEVKSDDHDLQLQIPKSMAWTLVAGLVGVGMWVGMTVQSVQSDIAALRDFIEREVSDITVEIAEVRTSLRASRDREHQMDLRIQRLELAQPPRTRFDPTITINPAAREKASGDAE